MKTRKSRAAAEPPVRVASPGTKPPATMSIPVREVLRGPRPQPKLTVSRPGDASEREADQVADHVMRLPEPARNHASDLDAPSDRQEGGLPGGEVRRRSTGAPRTSSEGLGSGASVPKPVAARLSALSGGGHPLPSEVRSFFEPRFGRDFGEVRLHTDPAAGELARSLDARAFTLGTSIVFGPDEYAPGSPAGRHLIAHELTHVLQQTNPASPAHASQSPGTGSSADSIARALDHPGVPQPGLTLQQQAIGNHADNPSSARPTMQRDDTATLTPTGRTERGTVQRNPDRSMDRRLEDKLDSIAGKYKYILLRQRDAVRDLLEDAQKEDPPPLWQTLLLGAAEVALYAATGGIGAAVGRAVASRLATTGIPDTTARFVSDAMTDATKKFGRSAVQGATRSIASTTSDPREIFFRGQRDALVDMADEAETEFTRNRKEEIRTSASPHTQADALFAGLEGQNRAAYTTQRNESLDRWASYQARGSAGGARGGGTDIPHHAAAGGFLPRALATPGILRLEVRVEYPGDTPVIRNARIAGLNEGLRGIISSRPIGQLKMPIAVRGEVGADIGWLARNVGRRQQPVIRIARNEEGTVFLYSGTDRDWLHARAHGRDERPDTIFASGRQGFTHGHIERAALDGARLLMRDLDELTIGRGNVSG